MQITRFQDNFVCLYYGLHHTVSDGAASSLFAYYWNELMVGREPPFEPVHDRSLLKVSCHQRAFGLKVQVLGARPNFNQRSGLDGAVPSRRVRRSSGLFAYRWSELTVGRRPSLGPVHGRFLLQVSCQLRSLWSEFGPN
jgi:hypothetical protein